MWAGAVEAAVSGRDPGPLAATARHLVSGGEAERRRALDVAQEVRAGRGEVLEVVERWLRPPASVTKPGSGAALRAHDAWLADLGAGALSSLEPLLSALRRPALFRAVPGPALAELASAASQRRITGELFALGDEGDAMFVVVSGSLVAHRPPHPERVIDVGGVVGELAVLSHAPRAATVRGGDAGAEVLAIDRATFTAAAQRAPELVLGLAATMASWIAPHRPDVL
jgi:CRP-like cAMP-binding protein